MLAVGCSGFPVPATRYLREFATVEVADTFLGVPGPAIVRRWKREAPDGFVFTALAPRDLTADAFKPGAAAESAWEAFLPVARDLGAAAVVISSPPDLPSSKVTRAAARALLERVAGSAAAPLVWEPPPGWDLKESEAAVKGTGVVVARDPTRHPPFAKATMAYYRLPGPAGHRSRYEDASIEAASRTLRESRAEQTLVVFANVDMYADAKRLRKLLEG